MRTQALYGAVQEDLSLVEDVFESLKHGDYGPLGDMLDIVLSGGGKTASLFATACEGGAIVSGQPDEWTQAFRDYGYNFGMAFQVVDDILDFTGDPDAMGKPVGSDLEQGTLTLPSLLLMDRSPKSNPIQKYFTRPSRERLAEAIQAVLEFGVIQESYEMARDFSQRANEALDLLPDLEDRQTLRDLTDYILDRRT